MKNPVGPRAQPRTSRFSRDRVVQIRMDPRTKLAAELAARHEHRSLSSFIESIVARVVQKTPIVDHPVDTEYDTGADPELARSAYAVACEAYDPLPLHRVRNLEKKFPQLLTFEEMRILKIIAFHKLEERYVMDEWTWLTRFAGSNEPIQAFQA